MARATGHFMIDLRLSALIYAIPLLWVDNASSLKQLQYCTLHYLYWCKDYNIRLRSLGSYARRLAPAARIIGCTCPYVIQACSCDNWILALLFTVWLWNQVAHRKIWVRSFACYIKAENFLLQMPDNLFNSRWLVRICYCKSETEVAMLLIHDMPDTFTR